MGFLGVVGFGCLIFNVLKVLDFVWFWVVLGGWVNLVFIIVLFWLEVEVFIMVDFYLFYLLIVFIFFLTNMFLF